MSDAQISIGQVKRDISELVNRVAFGGERIVLTSRGRPKAVLVSLEDYERIQIADEQSRLAKWQTFNAELESLHAQIMARRGGEPLDLEAIITAHKEEQEARHDDLIGH